MDEPNFIKNEPDPIKVLMDQLAKEAPVLINKALNREKRHKLTLELTNEELFKLSEFMTKEGMGKAQVGEID